MTLRKKKKFILWIIILAIIIVIIYRLDFSQKKVEYGITFSPLQAERLGLDWKNTYLSILDELKVKKLRLSAYWNVVESEQNIFDWRDLDWQIEEADKRGVKVILVIGRRVPRWPECHDPKWLGGLSQGEQEKNMLNLLKKEIEHYKNYKNITTWQVENEPTLSLFGACPEYRRDFLKEEISLVKSLDNRPVLVTDSGELSLWLRTSGISDYLGTSIYLKVWHRYFKSQSRSNPIGYWQHIFPPLWYYLRAQMAEHIFGNKGVIVSELQSEPWETGIALKDTPIAIQYKGFNLKNLQEIISLAKKSGFDEIYFWGAEWWYWLKNQGDDAFWQEAKNIFRDN